MGTQVRVNNCSYEELLQLPGKGSALEGGEGVPDFHDLSEIPYLKVTHQLVKLLDFTTYKEISEGIIRMTSGSMGKRSKKLMSW